MTDRSIGRWRAGFAVLMVLGVVGLRPAMGQIPGLPGSGKAAPTTKDDPSAAPVPAKGEPGAVFSTTSGPIKVDQAVDDAGIEGTLNDLLIQYPGVRTVIVKARDGVVTLDGQALDEPTISKVTVFAQKVEGVRFILNKMKTDAEVLSGTQLAASVVRHYGEVVAQNWVFALVALVFLLGFIALARLFSRYSETLLAPFLGNPLLRSVAGSILSTALILLGIMTALSVLNLTQAVLSILGLAGVVSLAVGFAFRDIAENFIASMLLGLRRPFGLGDFVTVAGRSGSVLALDTRATTLITPEGNHVSIPNAVIYKETMVNASRSPSTLKAIEVMIPYEASIAAALEAISEALCSSDAVLSEPKPRALVDALEVDGVRLKATFWMPTKGVDGDKLQSDLRLKIKVALQKAGITPPSSRVTISSPGPTPIAAPANGRPAPASAAPADHAAAAKTAAVAAANLRKDSEAAAQAAAEPAEQEATPIDHAIRQAEAEAVAEGGNLLVNSGKSA